MKTLRVLILLVITPFIAFSCDDDDEGSGSIITVGNKIPDFTVSGPFDAPHDTFSTSRLAGKRGMIVFFVSYCPDCHAILPTIDGVWKRRGEIENFDMALISRTHGYETPQLLYDYWWQTDGEPSVKNTPRFSMPYYLDPGAEVYFKFAGQYVPRIYLINTDGTVARMWVEKLELSADELIEAIKEL